MIYHTYNECRTLLAEETLSHTFTGQSSNDRIGLDAFISIVHFLFRSACLVGSRVAGGNRWSEKNKKNSGDGRSLEATVHKYSQFKQLKTIITKRTTATVKSIVVHRGVLNDTDTDLL